MMRYTRALNLHRMHAPAPAKLHRGGLVAALVLLLAACGGHREVAQPGGSEALPPLATRLFSVAYDQISERYVQQVALSNLTGAGLNNLAKLDAKFEVRQNGGRIELREEGVQIALLDTPTNEADARRWAQLTQRTTSPCPR